MIEDDLILGESLVQRFEIEGVKVNWVRRISEAQPLIEHRQWGAVISDVRLPDGLATDWFTQLPAEHRRLPWFLLTGYGSVNDAVSALHAGAREYLTKPFDIEKLVEMVLGALTRGARPTQAVLGISPAMRQVEETARRLAKQKTSVLLMGESGVGKEVVAQLIHSLDSRSTHGEFIPVNCAAVPDSMMEAEFFGYEKGAFTGAHRMHKGFVERANGGTLFLDEVGDLPAHMQAKFLRVLQERSFFRLGSEKTTRSDFRIIAATNRDLYADMLAGTFREDLFYRLAVIRIEIPPLRERPEDIRWLTEIILQQITAEQGIPIAVSEMFMRDLMARNWRGNVRELRAYLEQAVILSNEGVLDVPAPLHAAESAAAGPGLADVEDAPTHLHVVVDEVERRHIRAMLLRSQGNMGNAAALLGISRKTLWEKMRKLGVSKDEASSS